MYICLEGIKGAGKSTVFSLICQQLNQDGEHFSMVCPTRPKAGFSLSEQAFRLFGNDCPDRLTEYVYARRSDYHWQLRDKSSPLLLGDRSIVTSYVTRFDSHHPHAAIQRVNQIERLIALPDVVFLLDIEPREACKRIATRPHRCYGRREESYERLEKTTQAYRYLMQHGGELGLGSINWQTINVQRAPQEIADCIVEKIQALRAT